MKTGAAYEFAMEKTAFLGLNADPTAFKNAATGLSMFLGATALSANILTTIYRKISNDTRRKAIIEDLASNDIMLKEVDKDQLKEWYATMYYYAPTMTADKATVREVLQMFARFGKIDVKTLQLLTDTEDKLNKMKSDSFVTKLLPKMTI